MKLSIIIPVYNEKDLILEVLRKVEATPLSLEKEIIIVDDGSTDGTREILKNLNKYKILFKENGGKGSALKLGIQAATGDYILFQDADLEYNPADYQNMVEPLLVGKADMVLSRRIRNDLAIMHIGIGPYLAKGVVAFLINGLYRQHFSDYWSCYKAFKSDKVKQIQTNANSFEYEIEAILRLLRQGVKAVEVPVSYTPRTYAEGKKIRIFPDAFLVIFSIFKIRFFQ